MEQEKLLEILKDYKNKSNKDLFLTMFYNRIPRKFWGEPTNDILMKHDLKKS